MLAAFKLMPSVECINGVKNQMGCHLALNYGSLIFTKILSAGKKPAEI